MADPTSAREPSATSPRFQDFHALARHRIQHIVLVSSLYDSFILAEDGQLNELILSEFLDLNIRHVPSLTRVSSGSEAVALAGSLGPETLIITSMHVGDMDALTLARGVRDAGLETPVVLLAYDSRELDELVRRHDVSIFEQVFLWQGDVRILLAIVKCIEDRMNVAHDTGLMGVQAIILVEDSIRFYSSYLPAIYAELMQHSHRLVPEGLNLSHKLLRVQARPKILLCDTFEAAWEAFSTYRVNILGVIADVEFFKGGALYAGAGVELARRVRLAQPDVPIMLQSSFAENEVLAAEVGASFLLKGSPFVLNQLRRFMIDHLGFGDFVFRMPDGREVGRASDLKSLEAHLPTVPADSLAYHAERNHFSKWLKARTEFALAHSLRPRKVSDFATLEDLRADLIHSIHDYRQRRQRGAVADFDETAYDPSAGFSRIGSGSLGGKARGLAFVNRLLDEAELRERFADVEIAVPPSVVLATDVFDAFLAENDLADHAIRSDDEAGLRERFLRASLPEPVIRHLRAYIETTRYPLAVRSSTLLEDSQYQPFAGIYETYMLPNNDPDVEARLARLLTAIARVYASTFSTHAKAYLRTTPYRLEEEKMAVILQQVIGRAHGPRFYPDFAGVARSHNFYPIPPQTAADGVAAVALGLGTTVVNGEPCVRFCPRYPRHVVAFSSVRSMLRNSQREFYALDLGAGSADADSPSGVTLSKHGLDVAESDGTLQMLGSTFSPADDAVFDGVSRPGVRLVSFAPVLKHEVFPLSDILCALLRAGEAGTGAPVEIEFAASLSAAPGRKREFAFLQLRPLAMSREAAELEFGEVDPPNLLCSSSSVLGNGRIDTLRDLLVIDYHRFERLRSQDVAAEVARLNGELVGEGVQYVLIGVGRWGSSDPLLGIPVTWDQIAGARVIVEAGFRDFEVTPSQGTHFFQNLTSANIGYFTANPEAGKGTVDWDWLAGQPAVRETATVRHLRFSEPLLVVMNGRTNQGMILKPGVRPRRPAWSNRDREPRWR